MRPVHKGDSPYLTRPSQYSAELTCELAFAVVPHRVQVVRQEKGVSYSGWESRQVRHVSRKIKA